MQSVAKKINIPANICIFSVTTISIIVFLQRKSMQRRKLMPYNTFILPNGLRIIHAPSPTNVTYCGFAVDAGTRDEFTNEQGMAHFVEHLIFKGTRKRRAWHILNRMENVQKLP